METLQKLIYIWYNNYPDTSLGISISGTIGVIGVIGLFIYGAWTDKLKLEDGVYDTGAYKVNYVTNIFKIFIFCLVGAMLIYATSPLIIIIGLLCLIGKVLGKWGNNYRSLEKSKEKRREEILGDMLKSDPIFYAKYNQLMRDTPELND